MAPHKTRRTARALKRLTPVHWAYIHFKFALGVVWPTVLWLLTPTAVNDALQRTIVTTMAGATILGGIMSITGLIMTAQRGRVRTIGVSIELAGIALLSSGPLSYFFTQAYLALSNYERAALAVFAYAMLAALICRFVMLLPWFIREAQAEGKDV
ncbi:hypothetical protein [Arthrobacter agilis]|uniref:hypothetical protein n=1 Tax=Arthrobacter agilis TaxID=37921 RepID=UPI0027D7C349|nr:hypothetical protein [Arthrobacter agilis]